jgi:hypothetical protein
MGILILVAIGSFRLGVLLMSLVVAGREEELPDRVEQARRYPTWHRVPRWAVGHAEGGDSARWLMPGNPAQGKRTGFTSTIGGGVCSLN